ncbi:MAG: dehydrogenase [Gammaproteobacteria bacterium]|nr:MAG: dehydrogenase [Gammaproteobacteria bacterium]
MKQILQNLANGETSLVEVPCPQNVSGSLLIATRNTVVSAGTERMLVDFGKANYLEKARQQPDKVKQVLAKVKTDGLAQTVDAVRSKLDQPLPLGYCNAGVVLESGVEGFEPGDRVVSNGNHAEVVRVPKNLCARIPDGVDDESAAFTVLGAIGLQGVRLLAPTLGECIVVTGLGLIGLLCVQMLRANGCRVLGIDFDSHKCKLARQFGAETVDLSKGEDPVVVAQGFSRERGVDGVLVTAASRSDEIMHQAAQMCRKRGRIVLVGVVGLNLRRDDFFKKELTFQVSASYGPGRYDSLYEEKGQDYPIGFVRWTEQRNFEAVLDMMAVGSLDVKPLITHRFAIDEAIEAYKLLDDASALGIVLAYPERDEQTLRRPVVILSSCEEGNEAASGQEAEVVVGCVGAGNYASRTLIPAFREAGVVLDTLVTSGGVSGVHHGRKNGFRMASTRIEDLWQNEVVNTVAIVTRHDVHAAQVVAALGAGKHVFVEKPLALTLEELDDIEQAYLAANEKKPTLLMVGFNRRFAPHIVKMKSLLEARRSPKSIIMTVNAGAIPSEHWVQDHKIGGGRIIGEGCHFIDLMRYLVGSPVIDSQVMMMGNAPGVAVREDKVSITLSFEDGSFGTIHYLANGSPAFPKERVEVFCDNAVLQMDNYRILRGYGWHGFKSMKLMRQDKGQKACVKAFVEAVRGKGAVPVSCNELLEVSRISIEVARQ